MVIDRKSNSAFVELHEKAARPPAADLLRHLIAAAPYKVHTLLADNGTHFPSAGNTAPAVPDIKPAIEAEEPFWAHAFEYSCVHDDIDHRLTKPKHSLTHGEVERAN